MITNQKSLVKALLRAQTKIAYAQSSLVDADMAVEAVIRVLELDKKTKKTK